MRSGFGSTPQILAGKRKRTVRGTRGEKPLTFRGIQRERRKKKGTKNARTHRENCKKEVAAREGRRIGRRSGI